MESNPLQRVWVITGTNAGLGFALASYVLSKGDRVIASVRSLTKFPQSLKEQGARPLVMDLSSSDTELKRAAHEAIQVYGQVDVLVNNASWGVVGPWEETDMDELRDQFQTIFFGTVSFTQGFLSHFRLRRAGSILNVSSGSSIGALPGWGGYSAAKAALNVFTDSLNGEMEAFGVQALSLLPGYFPSQFVPTLLEKKRPESTIYTDPSQGYGSSTHVHEVCWDAGQVGDVDKLAARVYEVVARTGIAKDLKVKQEGRYDWTLVPLGSDCEHLVKEKLEAMLANVNATEPIWRSTNMDQEKLRLLPRSL